MFFIFIFFFLLLTPALNLLFLSIAIKLIKIKKEKLIEQEMPLFLGSFVSAIKAGVSPLSFLHNYSKNKSIIQKPILKMIKRLEVGVTLSESLKDLESDINHVGFRYFCCAFLISLQTGANLSKTIEKTKTISQNILDQNRQIKTKTIQLRFQAYIIAFVPLLIFAFISISKPERFFGIFNDSLSLKVLFTALSFDALGMLVIFKLIKSPFKKTHLKDFIFFLDLISLSINSGKSLHSAILLLKQINLSKNITEFIKDFEKALQSGQTIPEAFQNIKKYIQASICDHLIFLIKENLSYGMPIAKLFEEISKEVNNELSSSINTQIEKLPIKLLFPLMFLIAPATITLIIFPILFI